ncbi:hypothetical protein J7L67_05010 [bacterium]|nr:hypothetical protein [bacterium]
MDKYFFIGIAGTGMSRLAIFLTNLGINVCGSDRFYPGQKNHPIIKRLLKQKIKIYPQNADALTNDITKVVVSAAIEDTNADLIKARELSLQVITRSKLLADIFNKCKGLAITGTSGKTTITGMVSTVLRYAKQPHFFYCGDDICREIALINPPELNKNAIMAAEVDESDGSPIFYNPAAAVISNISLDHKELNIIMDIFFKFISQCTGVIILNADCPSSMILKNKIKGKEIKTFAIHKNAHYQAKNIVHSDYGIDFMCNKKVYTLKTPGLHNCYNALCAIAMLESMGIKSDIISDGLSGFKGMSRRLELVAERNGIKIYDDYSHNPDKIFAALKTLKRFCNKLFFVFRPHGYGPMIFFRTQLIDAICKALDPSDYIYFLDIYDAGGSANRTIHSENLINDLKRQGLAAQYISDPAKISSIIKPHIQSGDTVVIMGARDPYLSIYSKKIAHNLLQINFSELP